MSDYNSRDIYFSLKEYRNNYSSLLNSFLSKHEDFDEINFIENELDLYDLCLENATLTLYTFKGEYKYVVNFGNCRFIISKIYDNLVTFKNENDGWDLDLALKYQVTFKKIIDFLKERKDLVSNINTKKYNNLISTAKSPEVRNLLTKILYNDITIFNVINYINSSTNSETYDLFIKEFNSCCQFIFNEFMFEVNDEDIIKALDVFSNNLEYVYVHQADFDNIKAFVKELNDIKTVWNVSGLLTEKAENTVQLVYLNNLMIDYYDGFFANPIEGFENISHLKYVCNYLNNIKKNHSSDINNSRKTENNNTEETKLKKEKKPSEKWYALLYFIQLKVSNSKPPTTFEGVLIRKQIEDIGKQMTGTTGQSFYRAFYDLNKSTINNNFLEKSFDKNWKQKVIAISNNDELIISYLNSFN